MVKKSGYVIIALFGWLKQKKIFVYKLWFRRGGHVVLTNDMISDLIQGLQKIFGSLIEQIILYGSVARNEATNESDVDIAIILTDEMDEKVKEKFLIWSSDMDLRYDRFFSIVDIRKDKMEQWGNILPFYRNIQKEGIILWSAA